MELGIKKRLTSLYESNKAFVDTAATLLAGDEAGSFCSDIWKDIIGKAGTDKNSVFSLPSFFEAARNCAVKKDKKAFSSASLRNTSAAIPDAEVFTGDANAAFSVLREAFTKISIPERFAVLMSALGLDESSISSILKVKSSAASRLVSSAVSKLSDLLEGSGVSLSQLSSLMNDHGNEISSDASDAGVLHLISDISKKKNITLLYIGILAVSLTALILGFLSLIDRDKTPDAPQTSLDMTKTYYADIEIENYGTITVELDPANAPLTVENFVTLAQSGFYDGLTFHRIIEGFMMQGGAAAGGKTASTIKGEFSANGVNNELKHKRGVISMARANAYDSASSQFFICHQDAPHLDGGYAAFGTVVSGIEIVDAVCADARPIDNNGTISPDQQPKIVSIKIRVE